MTTTTAFVGVTGGAGTTRLSVECTATLAREGHSVVLVDAAFGTQGLATYVDGRIEPDLTAVLTGGAAFSDALVDVWTELDARVALCPAHAPFERIARAKSADAARTFETSIDHTAGQFDHVIVDVPPVAANQSVAAVTTVDQRALVAPDTRRGADLLPRMRGRLVDIGTQSDVLVANRIDDEGPTHLSEADHTIPIGDETPLTPSSIDPDTEFDVAVTDLAGALFDYDIEFELPSQGLFD